MPRGGDMVNFFFFLNKFVLSSKLDNQIMHGKKFLSTGTHSPYMYILWTT